VPLPTTDDLRKKQVEWFLARVTSEKAKAEFAKDLGAAYDALVARPVGELVNLDAVTAAVDASLTKERFDRGTRPLTLAADLAVLKLLRTDKTKLGTFVSDATKKKIDRFLDRPKLMNEKLLRRVIEQDAVEELLRDAIYDGLKEFNERVNPFVADWGIPGLLKKLGPFGFGPLSKSIEGVRTEFDKRLEPEMRKFLQVFSRKALKKASDTAVAKGDDPKSQALRKSVVAWFYEQELRELVGNIDDDNARLLHEISVDVAEYASGLQLMKDRRRESLATFVKLHEKEPVLQVLAYYGVQARPDTDSLASALWPAVCAVLKSDAVREKVTTLVGEFWDEIDGSSGS
jgi:hypothetical protein